MSFKEFCNRFLITKLSHKSSFLKLLYFSKTALLDEANAKMSDHLCTQDENALSITLLVANFANEK